MPEVVAAALALSHLPLLPGATFGTGSAYALVAVAIGLGLRGAAG